MSIGSPDNEERRLIAEYETRFVEPGNVGGKLNEEVFLAWLDSPSPLLVTGFADG